jgi:hypothetical protein
MANGNARVARMTSEVRVGGPTWLLKAARGSGCL